MDIDETKAALDAMDQPHPCCPCSVGVALGKRISELERTLLSTQIQSEERLRRVRELEAELARHPKLDGLVSAVRLVREKLRADDAEKRIRELEDQLRARQIDVNSAALSEAHKRIRELEAKVAMLEASNKALDEQYEYERLNGRDGGR